MGEVRGCNSIPKSTTLCGGSLAHLEKHPHTRTLVEVDLSLVSSRPLG